MTRERNYVKDSAPPIVGTHRSVKVADLHPNPWNYNTQSSDTFSKLLSAIRRHGFTKPIVARTRAAGGLEIVDGEHRWRAAQFLDMGEVPVIDLGEVPDGRAKEMTVILNELGGTPDEVRLADLLREVTADVNMEELLSVMPFTPAQMETYVELVDFKFDALPKGDTRAPVAETDQPEKGARPSPRLKRNLTWSGKDAKKLDELVGRLNVGDEEPEDVILTALERCVDLIAKEST